MMLHFLESIGVSTGKEDSSKWKARKNVLLTPEELKQSVNPLGTVRQYYQHDISKMTPTQVDMLKKDLTVEPKKQPYETKQASFNVYKIEGNTAWVPRFYGKARWGKAV